MCVSNEVVKELAGESAILRMIRKHPDSEVGTHVRVRALPFARQLTIIARSNQFLLLRTHRALTDDTELIALKSINCGDFPHTSGFVHEFCVYVFFFPHLTVLFCRIERHQTLATNFVVEARDSGCFITYAFHVPKKSEVQFLGAEGGMTDALKATATKSMRAMKSQIETLDLESYDG